ncbi:GNAT family N-acetyltransferase [Phytohabitans suffuscus]|uniref:GNAT family acetyltransferase n=1 Tax=Phytohabitans suffuscus TaxID=624315 RepID=A0A6F8YPC7_9ACTN|nr:GNAT family N-acetyltransferase [Phytohabitans suffuscus]BCB87934.1 GNAT family acetyltransferase [Phytohabitans suffuscus]
MSDLAFRAATRDDLPAIVALLADDTLGAARESAGDPAYAAAFDAIEADPRNTLVVADRAGEVVGTMQLTYIPGLSHRGGERLQIEAVRVRADQRGLGLGREMIGWAVEQARARGCRLVQLTTDKRRTDAHRFYASLGFTASHEGMKLAL